MWTDKNKKDLEDSMKKPFCRVVEVSTRSSASQQRENSVNTLLSRVSGQVKEMKLNNLPYSTPEEWDDSFYKLGGGSSRRKSKTILSRMSWKKFLNILESQD